MTFKILSGLLNSVRYRKLTRALVRGIDMHHGVTFNFGSAKVCAPAILETCFSYDRDIWIAANDYNMYFYKIVLFY